MFLQLLLFASLLLVISAIPQDIHIHLDGDSPGKGPDAGAGVVEGGEDYTSDTPTEGGTNTRERLEKEIKELEEKLKNCRPGTDRGPFKPDPKCKQKPRKTGPCKAAIKKWTFVEETKMSGDSITGTTECVAFTYGGCKGNDNKFDRKIECEMACIGQGNGEPPKPRPPKGPKRYATSDYNSYPTKDNNPDPTIDYNQETGTDYASDSEGQSGSGPFIPHPECKLKPNVTGRFCTAAVKKWTLIFETKMNGESISATPKCVEFRYGGCGGNNNNFPNKLACERSCIGQGVGEPPKGPGPKRYETSEAGTDYASDSEGGDGDVKCSYSCDKKTPGNCRADWKEGRTSHSGTCIGEDENPAGGPGTECAVHDKCKDCHAQMRKKGKPCGSGKGDTGGANPSGDDNIDGDGNGDGGGGGIKCEYSCKQGGNCRADWTKTSGRTESSGYAECPSGDKYCFNSVPDKCKSCHSAMEEKGEPCE